MSDAAAPKNDSNFSYLQRSEMYLSLALLGILVILLVPLPTMLLDMLLAMNLGFGVLILLLTLNAKRPLDFSVFPSLLLLMTLFRLALNVGTTRLILLQGDAGKIVDTFGSFVAGGNLVVGIVIFTILVVIQFVVITKGASRVSEVNARFVLDAMPGKQVTIDAELNAQSITVEEAKIRRNDLTREAEFNGAMDGASRFVRGDAIAGLIITVVNIIGGIMIGLSQGQTIAEAFQLYTLLTIGDGLVSQVPALIIATSSGILVTKAANESSLGDELGGQLLNDQKPLFAGAIILIVMSFTPGLPKLPFFLIAAFLFFAVQKLRKSDAQLVEDEKQETEKREEPESQKIADFLETDRISLEVGSGLQELIDGKSGKTVPERIRSMRRDMAQKYGIWVPTFRLKGDTKIPTNEYRVLIKGQIVAAFQLELDELLAINPGKATADIPGRETIEPTFNFPAKWISKNSKSRALMAGYTVVDSPTVIITNLRSVIRRYAHELLSREDLKKMLDQLLEEEIAPTVVEEVTADTQKTNLLHQVLIQLLKEAVPISALDVIIESFNQHAGGKEKSVDKLTDQIRVDLGRAICERFKSDDGRVRVILADHQLQNTFTKLHRDGKIVLDQPQLESLSDKLKQEIEKSSVEKKQVALMVNKKIRRAVKETLARSVPNLAVIAFQEIPTDMVIETAGSLRFEDIFNPNQQIPEFSAEQQPVSNQEALDGLNSGLAASA